LDKLLDEKSLKKTSMIYRGTIDGFMFNDFHLHCDKAGSTVSLLKVKKNQNWIGGFTTV
jgi:hypothetical protein